MKKNDLIQGIVAHVDSQIEALGQKPEPELQEAMYQNCFALISKKIDVQSAYRAGAKLLAEKKQLLRKSRDEGLGKASGLKASENDQKMTPK